MGRRSGQKRPSSNSNKTPEKFPSSKEKKVRKENEQETETELNERKCNKQASKRSSKTKGRKLELSRGESERSESKEPEAECVNEEDDLDEDLVGLHSNEDGEFDSAKENASAASLQGNSDVSGVTALSPSEDEERVNRIVAEDGSDTEPDSEADRERVTDETASEGTPKVKRSKKVVQVKSPEPSGSSKRQQKQLEEITEFFRQKGAIDKAYEFIKELRCAPARSQHKDGEKANSSSTSTTNTNSNAEIGEQDQEQEEGEVSFKAQKSSQKKRKLPTVDEAIRAGVSTHEGIDASRLYSKPRLSGSEVTVYSSNSNKGFQKQDEGQELNPNGEIEPVNVNSGDDSDLSNTVSAEIVESDALNSSDEGKFSDETIDTDIFTGDEQQETVREEGMTGRPRPQARVRSQEDKRRALKKQTDQRLTQADRTKTDALKPEGNFALQVLQSLGGEFEKLAIDLQTLRWDNEFDPLAAEIDPATYTMMEEGKYVDIRKILPKESLFEEEDDNCRFEIVNERGGAPKFMKVRSDAEKAGINSIKKWLVGFNIYATAYSKRNPHRASEIFQYILDIQEAALTYTWESVYTYDRVVRRLMERNPNRRWNTPYTKYWNKLLKVKTGFSSNSGHDGHRRNSDQGRIKREICWKFNKGKCNRGDSCYRDHRCNFCGKFGHGEHVCRLKKNKREKEAAGTQSGGTKEIVKKHDNNN